MTPAQTFSAELRRAMTVRGCTGLGLAAAVGMSRTGICDIRSGATLPYHGNAVRLSEALDWPALVDLSLKLRGRVCVACGRAFLDDSSRLYGTHCSKDCRNRDDKRRQMEVRRTDAAVTQRKLDKMLTVLGEYCHWCEPEGICRTPECKWRKYTGHVKGGAVLDITPPAFGVARVKRPTVTQERQERTRAQKRDYMRRVRGVA